MKPQKTYEKPPILFRPNGTIVPFPGTQDRSLHTSRLIPVEYELKYDVSEAVYKRYATNGLNTGPYKSERSEQEQERFTDHFFGIQFVMAGYFLRVIERGNEFWANLKCLENMGTEGLSFDSPALYARMESDSIKFPKSNVSMRDIANDHSIWPDGPEKDFLKKHAGGQEAFEIASLNQWRKHFKAFNTERPQEEPVSLFSVDQLEVRGLSPEMKKALKKASKAGQIETQKYVIENEFHLGADQDVEEISDDIIEVDHILSKQKGVEPSIASKFEWTFYNMQRAMLARAS